MPRVICAKTYSVDGPDGRQLHPGGFLDVSDDDLAGDHWRAQLEAGAVVVVDPEPARDEAPAEAPAEDQGDSEAHTARTRRQRGGDR